MTPLWWIAFAASSATFGYSGVMALADLFGLPTTWVPRRWHP